MQPNYDAHERAYQRRKDRGESGWADEETVRRSQSTISRMFNSPCAPTLHPRASVNSPLQGLEFGCGAGELSCWCAEQGFRMTGIDISPTAIAWARDRASQLAVEVEFQVGCVLDASVFHERKFDFLLDGHCFHCIIGADRDRFLRNARRLMNPDGRMLIKSMCGDLNAPHLNVSSELRDRYDPNSYCITDMIDGQRIATRWVAPYESILEEIQTAALEVLEWNVISSSGRSGELDELVAWIRPADVGD